MKTPVAQVHNFGCVGGVWRDSDPDPVLAITEFAEKPDAEYARKYLRVDGLADDEFLTLFGQYVLEARIFDFLEEHIAQNFREGGEFQLTSCLDRLRREDDFSGYLVQGRRFDIGLPDAYRQTLIDFRHA
jgi:UTP--glucose-1-phosphate uridylyltransferase